MAYLIVFAGAGLGGAMRHGVNLLGARLFGLSFPWATLVINVTGSLFMGLLIGGFAMRGAQLGGSNARLFLTTGLLGGYTTFSTFSLDAITLFERGAVGAAASYVLGSAALGLLALMAGLATMRALL